MSSPVTTTADLNAHLQVLTSSATTGQMSDLGVVTQELPQGMGESRGLPFLEKQLEAHEKGLEALLNGGGLLILSKNRSYLVKSKLSHDVYNYDKDHE